MPRVIEKVLNLKQVVFKPGRRTIDPAPFHELIDEVSRKAKTASGRHWPDLPLDEAELPQLCCALDHFAAGKIVPNGIGFRLTAYRPRELPEQLKPDFSGRNLAIQREAIVGNDGTKREIVGTAHAVAFGEVIVVESSRGAGGIHAMERCLSHLVRKYCTYPGDGKPYPAVHLRDVPDHSLLEALRRNGGAVKMVIALDEERDHSASRFAKPAGQMRHQVKGTSTLSVSYQSDKDGTLDEQDVIEAFDDLALQELDGVSITMKRGGKVFTSSDFKVSRRLALNDLGGGEVDSKELLASMSNYLLELMEPKAGTMQMIDEHGKLTVS